MNRPLEKAKDCLILGDAKRLKKFLALHFYRISGLDPIFFTIDGR